MGLDATSYRNAIPRMDVTWGEDRDPPPGLIRSPFYPEFSHAAQGLDLGTPTPTSSFNAVFVVGPMGADSAMSYGGYSHFRDVLAALSGRQSFEDLEEGDPFWEMCWMSDCDGFFSTQASQKIAQDFIDHQAQWHAWCDEKEIPSWHRARYMKWAAVFIDAATHNGIVLYH